MDGAEHIEHAQTGVFDVFEVGRRVGEGVGWGWGVSGWVEGRRTRKTRPDGHVRRVRGDT